MSSYEDHNHVELVSRVHDKLYRSHDEIIEAEGYEVTELDEQMYIHAEGRDNCTAWTEVIDGKLMLCIGNELGEDARYLPGIVAHIITIDGVGGPLE